jgi:dTDP-4-dehydrorhamnose reductase
VSMRIADKCILVIETLEENSGKQVTVESSNRALELWGGVECTLNRVDDVYFDQLATSGHLTHFNKDLARFTELGIRTFRTALHWERFEQSHSWTSWDNWLSTMQALGVRPIVGLVHHGSGPKSTNLLDPLFPEKLAAYALQVAQHFPHVLDYTPVNEPQTTGRFACLYGLWYPHHRDMRSYVRSLLNQVKGIVLAMQAIRKVQPAARLIHTEDGGRTFATPPLESYRVEREHRRWLGIDLLCGRVNSGHPLFAFLLDHGITSEEVRWFTLNPCPPDILGLNYYVTSDRFLDHRLGLYPPRAGGDTGDEPLVDIEAVRVRAEGINGIGAMLSEAWDRYHLPLAVTEVHLGCEPVEQTRWLAEAWREAQAARKSGVDVRAITAWALLGSFNWCHLCTQDTGSYEPGVFDLSGGDSPTRTPLADLAARLAQGQEPDGSSNLPKWWCDCSRLTMPPA